MILRKPAYYDRFRCIAAQCPDSCCKDWEVVVDPESAQYYRSLPGELGDALRQVLTDWEDGCALMAIENGRCPMWRKDSLCRIQAELGHDSLCKTCREFPRLTHDYGSFVEIGLELSCPEAARLILSGEGDDILTETVPGGEPGDYVEADMAVLLQTREQALQLLDDPSHPINQTLALLLFYGCHAQSLLDGIDPPPFDPKEALETAYSLAKTATPLPLRPFFRELEILTPAWQQRLESDCQPGVWANTYRLLARYFVQRYWLQAISDFDLMGRVKLCVILCLLIRDLGGNLLQTAQLCSKEIENNTDNVDAILDAAYRHPAFTDDRLLALLLDP